MYEKISGKKKRAKKLAEHFIKEYGVEMTIDELYENYDAIGFVLALKYGGYCFGVVSEIEKNLNLGK